MNESKVKQGKKNRKKGSEWERIVRKDLESKGWIVAKWTNNVEFGYAEKIKGEEIYFCRPYDEKKKFGRLIQAKRKYNPFTKRPMAEGTGMPDFICYRLISEDDFRYDNNTKVEFKEFNKNMFVIVGVEAKSNGYLDKEEREKCEWLLDNNIFSKIFIASKGEKKEIIYKEVKDEI